jgi:chromosome segregation ATPase
MKKAAQIVPLVERIRTELKTRLTNYNQDLKNAIKALEKGKAELPVLKVAYKEAKKTNNEAEKIYEKTQDISYEAEEDLHDVEAEIEYAKRDIPELKEKIKQTEELLSALKEK